MYSGSLILFLMILAASTNLSSTCFASGVCGGGCAPPPPPVCAGGCGGGYSCGHYGCYRTRARAASSLTMSIDTLAKKAATPDEKFMACCIERSLPDSCLSKCSFRTYTKAALQEFPKPNEWYFEHIRKPKDHWQKNMDNDGL